MWDRVRFNTLNLGDEDGTTSIGAELGKLARIFATVVAVATMCSSLSVAQALPRKLEAKVYKSGLKFPVDLAWAPGTKKLFFTEKATGKIRVLVGRRLLKRPCTNLDVNANGERGALGIALHPRFENNHSLYVYYTNASPLENRVTRFEVRRNRCRRPRHVVRGIPSPSTIHQGGQLEFVKGALFVSVGDGGNLSIAQDLQSRLGKVLRYKPNGRIPRGNPFSQPGNRSPVWSYGHRNPFGLTHKPRTGVLLETENGPECDDEVNRIRKGRNYGWGAGYQCGTAGVGPNPKRPLHRWTSPIAPTDPAWYIGPLKALSGAMYVGDFIKEKLRRFNFRPGVGRVRRTRPILQSPRQITDVTKGPGGCLYWATVATINRIQRKATNRC